MPEERLTGNAMGHQAPCHADRALHQPVVPPSQGEGSARDHRAREQRILTGEMSGIFPQVDEKMLTQISAQLSLHQRAFPGCSV